MTKDAVPSAKGLERLVEALRVLPGVGPRSAQRMAFHLLQHDRAGGEQLAAALTQALATVRRCAKCNNFTEEEICRRFSEYRARHIINSETVSQRDKVS